MCPWKSCVWLPDLVRFWLPDLVRFWWPDLVRFVHRAMKLGFSSLSAWIIDRNPPGWLSGIASPSVCPSSSCLFLVRVVSWPARPKKKGGSWMRCQSMHSRTLWALHTSMQTEARFRPQRCVMMTLLTEPLRHTNTTDSRTHRLPSLPQLDTQTRWHCVCFIQFGWASGTLACLFATA